MLRNEQLQHHHPHEEPGRNLQDGAPNGIHKESPTEVDDSLEMSRQRQGRSPPLPLPPAGRGEGPIHGTVPVIEGSASFASGSAVSGGTQKTGTRFSFYNAEDFKVAGGPIDLPSSLSGVTQRPTPTASGALVTGDSTDNILQSLYAHERQRLQILKGTEASDADNSPTDDAHPTTQPHLLPFPAPVANPYEDAIKEALELLRRHRNSSSPSAAAAAGRRAPHALPPPSPGHDARHYPGMSVDRRSDRLHGGTGGSLRTPREADRVLQSRGDTSSVASMENDSISSHPGGGGWASGALPLPPDSPASSSLLGEAYQAEIEARRKQRQERMARYASRLAELKHESSEGGSTCPPYTPNGRAARYTAAGAVHDESHSTEDPAIVNLAGTEIESHSLRGRPASDEPAFSTSGTVSSITAPHREDELHTGVEKVLLAILERANGSRRDGSVGESASADSGDAGKASWQHGEEKKQSSSECAADETFLLQQAMSNLLGAKSSSTSSVRRSPSPLSHPIPSNDSTLGLRASDCDYDPIAASRSSDDGGYQYGPSSSRDTPTSSRMSPPHLHLRRNPSSPRSKGSMYFTELANTTEGIEAVASDPGMMSELDELVRKVSDRSNINLSSCESENVFPPSIAGDATARSNSRHDDSIDQRVRRLLTSSNSNHGGSSDNRRDCHGDESDEDDSIENTSVDRTSTGVDVESSYDGSLLDDDEDDGDYRNSDNRNDTIDLVLGPLNKRVGGTTGVVLEPDSPTHETPSILESLSAAVSLVVSGNHSAGAKGVGLFGDRFSAGDEGTAEPSGVVESDSEASGLMRSLCSHLLPFGVSRTSNLLDLPPEWDEGNPDEPGYRIVRLRKDQLVRIEQEFKLMVDNLKHSSERDLRCETGNDETFERDLQAAEDLLNQEEERLKVAASGPAVSTSIIAPLSPDRRSVISEDASVGLPDFPGVKRAGEGEMGDLEFFHLPIIFKSHVTGFEPTKDMSLEAGNVVAGQYLVEGELGSAAFSTAYRCIDLNSHGSGPDGHEEVCLKVIKNTKDFFDQSLDEIKILELLRQTGKCREKFIVEMRTFFYHREHLIIVTELLRQNLFEFGRFVVDNDEEPYFTLPRLGFITRQVLIALDFVHSLGLVHSDVKPENILLGSYSRAQVKLIDFGSSCYLTDRQSSYIQSRSYRAPEVVLGLPYDGRIDVWSLGCVVAEMFTGEVTFQNDSIVSMLSRIEAVCGPFPRHMIAQGRQSGRFFTKCGLLFERVRRSDGEDDDDSDNRTDSSAAVDLQQYDIFQPKATTLSARLGFAPTLLELGDAPPEQRRQAMFVEFVGQLLTIDPETRPTAAQALQHPWMQYAATLTESDIKYPSS